jgi:ABC-type polysaccharide/polyol phosphate export permease
MADPLASAGGGRLSPAVYDSDRRSPLLLTELANFWNYRALIRLLVTRDVLVRYKRSLLGVWWTLLNPLLTMTVMWLVFSHLFRFAVGFSGVPYVVYLLSGVIVIIFFQQGVETVASSIVLNTPVLSKVYVPAEAFALSAGLAAAINLLLSAIPLLIFQLALGVGIPWTILLVPLPILALLCLSVGLGLVVASIAVRFHDVLDFNRVILLLIGYMTPVFYLIAIVPHAFRHVIELNPVYYDLVLFRNLIYGDSLSSWQTWVAAFGSGIIVLSIGLAVFARNWRTAAAMI